MQLRRIITGEDGGSRVVRSEDAAAAESSWSSPVVTWDRVPRLPHDGSLVERPVWMPDPGGARVFFTTFPAGAGMQPLSERPGFDDWIAAYGANTVMDAATGMHTTDTIDVVFVISGEVVAVLEEGEVALRPGDCFVQNGTLHAWQNRSEVECVCGIVSLGTERAEAD